MIRSNEQERPKHSNKEVKKEQVPIKEEESLSQPDFTRESDEEVEGVEIIDIPRTGKDISEEPVEIVSSEEEQMIPQKCSICGKTDNRETSSTVIIICCESTDLKHCDKKLCMWPCYEDHIRQVENTLRRRNETTIL